MRLDVAFFVAALARVATVGRGVRLEALDADAVVALGADAVGPLRDAHQRGVDSLNFFDVMIDDSEIDVGQ